MSKVELISLTPDAEKTMAYIARVSNPNNQKNEDYSKLLSYCIKNEHWSVFEQAFMTLQIETNRGIAAQILRHRSFTFQEFSQRYADSSQLGNIPLPELRRQYFKNRQNSDCRIYAEEGICQLLFFEGDPCSTTYEDRRGKYQNQPEKVTLAKI